MAVVPIKGGKAFSFGGLGDHFARINTIERVIGNLIARDYVILTKNHTRILIDKFCFYFFNCVDA